MLCLRHSPAFKKPRKVGYGTRYGGRHAAPDALDDGVDALYRRVCAETAYTPQPQALPYAFVQRATEAEQVESLKYHAEKKALAALLARGAPDLELSINFKVCADCQHFLTHAAALLGRPIRVREPSREHVFLATGGRSTTLRQGQAAAGNQPRPRRRTPASSR